MIDIVSINVNGFNDVLAFVWSGFKKIIEILKNFYLWPDAGISLLHVLIALLVVSMILEAIFVRFSGDPDE